MRTSVSVRGAVLDAKVSLFVNGNPVGTPIFPARNTYKLEFTGLPALVAGDNVTAVQEKGGATAKSPKPKSATTGSISRWACPPRSSTRCWCTSARM